VLHGTWLRQLRIPGHYVPLHIEAEDLPNMLHALPRLGFVGANVTIPHKEAVLKLAHEVSEAARRIGAANTLSFGPGGRIHADNTDAYGFISNLRQNAPGWDAPRRPALVLGAGGAARAIIVALQDAGVPQIYLTNRTLARAQALADEFGVTALPWEDRAQVLPDLGALVNTTSLGMTGHPALEVDLATLPTSALVTDIVYTPLETPLLAQARARGCAVVDGLGMLLHQAVPGFERWFGLRPEVTDDLRRAVLAA
jgi:shikimate dehydrogenase